MRILDLNGTEVTNPDYDLGYTENETIVIAHHDPIEAVEEQWHYEVERVYPNGGRDLKRVIDVKGVEAREAWDETEEILRWHPYSEQELADRKAEEEAAAAEERELERLAAEREAAIAAENARLKAQVAALLENQQFLEDCIAEMAETVYA